MLLKSDLDVQQTHLSVTDEVKNIFQHFRPEGDAVKVQGGRNSCKPVEHLKDTSFKHSLEVFLRVQVVTVNCLQCRRTVPFRLVE